MIDTIIKTWLWPIGPLRWFPQPRCTGYSVNPCDAGCGGKYDTTTSEGEEYSTCDKQAVNWEDYCFSPDDPPVYFHDSENPEEAGVATVPCALALHSTGIITDNSGDGDPWKPEDARQDNLSSGALILKLNDNGMWTGGTYMSGFAWSGTTCDMVAKFCIVWLPAAYNVFYPDPHIYGWYYHLELPGMTLTWPCWAKTGGEWTQQSPNYGINSSFPADLFATITFSESDDPGFIYRNTQPYQNFSSTRAITIKPLTIAEYSGCCIHGPVCPAPTPATDPNDIKGCCCARVTFSGIASKASPKCYVGPINDHADNMNRSILYQNHQCGFRSLKTHCIQPFPSELTFGLTREGSVGGQYGDPPSVMPITTVTLSGETRFWDDSSRDEAGNATIGVETVTLKKDVVWEGVYLKPSREDFFFDEVGLVVLEFDEAESTPTENMHAADWSGAMATIEFLSTNWNECNNSESQCSFTNLLGWEFSFTATPLTIALDGPEECYVDAPYTISLSNVLWYWRGLLGKAFHADTLPTSGTITWGDGDTTALTISDGAITGEYSHTYDTADTYTVSVSISNARSGATSNSIQVTAQEITIPARPVLTVKGNSGTPQTAVAGDVLWGGTYTIYLRAIDGSAVPDWNSVDHYEVNWGDSEQVVSVPAAAFPIELSHTYDLDDQRRGATVVATIDVVAKLNDDQIQRYENVWRRLIVVRHADKIVFDKPRGGLDWGTDYYPMRVIVENPATNTANTCIVRLSPDMSGVGDAHYSLCVPPDYQPCNESPTYFACRIDDAVETAEFIDATEIRLTPICDA